MQKNIGAIKMLGVIYLLTFNLGFSSLGFAESGGPAEVSLNSQTEALKAGMTKAAYSLINQASSNVDISDSEKSAKLKLRTKIYLSSIDQLFDGILVMTTKKGVPNEAMVDATTPVAMASEPATALDQNQAILDQTAALLHQLVGKSKGSGHGKNYVCLGCLKAVLKMMVMIKFMATDFTTSEPALTEFVQVKVNGKVMIGINPIQPDQADAETLGIASVVFAGLDPEKFTREVKAEETGVRIEL